MERAWLVLVLVLGCGVAFYAMALGWRHRTMRDSGLPELPVTPTDLGMVMATVLTGIYVSTTTAGNWQDRVTACGLGRTARARVGLTAQGVRIERAGGSDIFVPLDDLVQVTTAPGIAGKVMGQADGVLIVRWRLGGVELDSGIRADDRQAQADFVAAAGDLLRGRGNADPGTSGADPGTSGTDPQTSGADPRTCQAGGDVSGTELPTSNGVS